MTFLVVERGREYIKYKSEGNGLSYNSSSGLVFIFCCSVFTTLISSRFSSDFSGVAAVFAILFLGFSFVPDWLYFNAKKQEEKLEEFRDDN